MENETLKIKISSELLESSSDDIFEALNREIALAMTSQLEYSILYPRRAKLSAFVRSIKNKISLSRQSLVYIWRNGQLPKEYIYSDDDYED